MKPSATGRILFWRGGSLWIGVAGEPTGVHAHHAVQIALPFPGGHARLQDRSGRWARYSAAIVPAHEPHAFEARGQLVAQVFVDPESRHGRTLQRRHRTDGITALPTAKVATSLAALVASFEVRASKATLIEEACSIIESLSGEAGEPTSSTDERVQRAVGLIRERIGESLTLAQVASAVHLSPDRLRHLFVAETGVTFRAYVLWLRLEQSLGAYIAGQSLTDAAFTGGFADSAHFSRTFRRMFGLAPASVRPE